ncbi:hypothetical protein H4R19_002359 [Coemansia spiralis]|nr:hypothetical protein H4R19_002359 [Coemansia spiralis]
MGSYEDERQEQIRENAEFLASLGIEKLVPAAARAPRPKRAPAGDRDEDDYTPWRDFDIRKRSKVISYCDDDHFESIAPTRKRARTKSGPLAGRTVRRKDAGRRIVGGRVYDSALGSTCHQCRQKTTDRKIACSNDSCTLAMDHKCLLNRYSEDAEALDRSSWTCPKCRGICNCSFCMKRRGKMPTGQLSTFIKLNGIEAAKEAIMADTISHTIIHPPAPRRQPREWLDNADPDGLVESDGDSDTLGTGGSQDSAIPTRKLRLRASSSAVHRLRASAKEDASDSSGDEDDAVDGDSDSNSNGAWAGWDSCPLDCIVLIE